MRVRVHPSVGWIVAALLAVCGCGRVEQFDPEPDASVVAAFRAGGGGDAAASAGEAAATATGTGWGTLRGTFVFAGDPPAVKNLSTGGKDGAVCDAAPIPDESLVIDSATKGLKNVVVFARKASRVHDDYAATANAEAVFDQKGCLFLSHVFAVRTSQPLLIKNSDPLGHNTNMTPPLEAGFNQSIPGGGSVTYQFKRAQNEPFAATCNVHPWMKAYIIPRSDPYVTVSDSQGKFELKNLPAGESIEFQVWHEKAPGGLAARPDWSKGRFKVTLAADQELDLGTVEVAPALVP